MKRYLHERIDAIAFDLDHTLYDRNETWSALTASFMRVFETSLSGEQLLRSCGEPTMRAPIEESSWRGMLQKLQRWGVVKPDVPFETFDAFIRTYFPDAIVPYKDTYRVLDWCRRWGLRRLLLPRPHRSTGAKAHGDAPGRCVFRLHHLQFR